MKKNNFIAIMFLMVAAPLQVIHADGGDYDLYLVAQDNTYTSLDYSNLRSLVFTQEREDLDGDGTKTYENYLTVNKKDGTSTVFNLSSSVAIMFADKSTGITDVKDAGKPIVINGKSLNFNKAGTIEVYQTDGRLVKSFYAADGESSEMTDLGKGIYIVKLGTYAVKILVK